MHLERYRGSMPADLAFMDGLVDVAVDARALKAGLIELTRVVNRPERSIVRRNRAATIGLSLHQPAIADALAVEQRHTTEVMAAALARAQSRGFIHPAVDTTAAALMFQAIALGLVLAESALPRAGEGRLDLSVAPRRALVVTLQLAIVLVITVLAFIGKKKPAPQVGLWATIGLLTIANVVIAVFW